MAMPVQVVAMDDQELSALAAKKSPIPPSCFALDLVLSSSRRQIWSALPVHASDDLCSRWIEPSPPLTRTGSRKSVYCVDTEKNFFLKLKLMVVAWALDTRYK